MKTAHGNFPVINKTTKREEYSCDQGGCKYRTVRRKCLKSHKRVHTGDLRRCRHEGCDYETPFKKTLTEHMKTHGKLLQCNWEGCDFRTAYSGALKTHNLFQHDQDGCDDKADGEQLTAHSGAVIDCRAGVKIIHKRQSHEIYQPRKRRVQEVIQIDTSAPPLVEESGPFNVPVVMNDTIGNECASLQLNDDNNEEFVEHELDIADEA